MPDQLQLRGGTTSEHNSFTGVTREVTVDTTKKTLVVHDGSQAGGTPLMKESGSNHATAVNIGTGGTTSLTCSSNEVVVNETGANINFRVEGQSQPHLLKLDAANNRVGVGIATPQTLMHLNASSARIQFTDATTGTGASDGVITGINGDQDFFINNRETGKHLLFFNGGGERLRIDTNGLVGILNDNPSQQLGAANNLVIGNTSHADSGMTFVSSTSGQSLIHFSDATSGNARYDGFLGYEQTGRFLKFGTAQSERMRLTSTGQLGLGTTSPSTVVHVADNDAELTLERTGTHSTSAAPLIQFKGRGPNATIYNFGKIDAVSTGSNNAGHLRFYTNASGTQGERMRIASDGKVGIGTTTPGGTLDIQGSSSNENQIVARSQQGGANVLIWNGQGVTDSGDDSRLGIGRNDVAMLYTSASASPVSAFAIGNTDAVPIVFSTSNTQRMRIESDGNVRIASEHLRFNTSGKGIIFGTEGGSDRPSIIGNYTSATNNNIQFGTTGSTRMTLDSGGRIGLGTTSPGGYNANADDIVINRSGNAGLTINTPNSSVGRIAFADPEDNNIGQIRYSHSENSLVFDVNADERLRIHSGGTLSLSGTHSGNAVNDAALRFAILDSNGNDKKAEIKSTKINDINSTLEFGTTVSNTYAERMRIHSNGNIGIGRTDPSAKVTINGAADDSFEGIRIVNTKNNAVANTAFIRLGITNAGGEKTTQIAAIQESATGNAVGLRFGTNTSGSNNGEGEKLRITSDGKVGIGTTAPQTGLAVQRGSLTDGTVLFGANYNGTGIANNSDKSSAIHGPMYDSDTYPKGVRLVAHYSSNTQTLLQLGGGTNSARSTTAIIFYTAVDKSSNGSEAARINTNRNLVVGTTSDDGGGSANTDDGCVLRKDGLIAARANVSTNSVMFTAKSIETSGYTALRCMSAQTNVGSVTFNSGGTSFNVSSDYRRKENVVNLTDGITRLKTLQPKRFNFKAEPSVTRDGFLAHEVTAVPEAVIGTKDAVATEEDVKINKASVVGEPIYQQLDQSKLVPLLVAALQEAVTKIETLEAKVAALEAA